MTDKEFNPSSGATNMTGVPLGTLVGTTDMADSPKTEIDSVNC